MAYKYGPVLTNVPDLNASGVQSPTDLAEIAARKAIERAGIQPEQIGLVIGDTATAWESIPAEAQRVAGRFGLKVPAYDVLSYSASFAAHIAMLLSWKEERVPRYILCFSTNTPTQFINYRSPASIETLMLSDAASAVVLSPVEQGKLQIERALHQSAGAALHAGIGSYGQAEIEEGFARAITLPSVLAMLQQAPGARTGEKLILPALSDDAEDAVQGGRPGASILSSSEADGDSLGARYAAVISEQWENWRPGDSVLAVLAGPGCGMGYVSMRGV